ETPPADTGPTTTTPIETTPAATTGVYTPEDLDRDACLRQRVVYFDFDQDTLRPEFQNIVACHAKYLRDRPSSRMTLEGHADERGSREYNV
ncbi:OmpA family protein, partial [Salmonella enterica]|uniref:OmpA family protein n=1 Tax=Salmonella enterica TaxID=28901 RepID=UPI0022B67708|nr:OmpA family protein [Salmonella enterica]